MKNNNVENELVAQLVGVVVLDVANFGSLVTRGLHLFISCQLLSYLLNQRDYEATANSLGTSPGFYQIMCHVPGFPHSTCHIPIHKRHLIIIMFCSRYLLSGPNISQFTTHNFYIFAQTQYKLSRGSKMDLRF